MDTKNNPILIKARTNMINNIKNSNIPLPQLANTIGVSVSVLQNFINGKTNINAIVMIKLSKTLNMTVDEFVGMKNL